ncbi:MAG: hypothetical protein KJ060_21565 [Candidatus Hydrogenedentes bacterium]|nr:hypothetical protein [Candidatus Hydrogenedentota bacterium]
MGITHRENFERLTRSGQAEWTPFTLDVGGVPGFTPPILERIERETGSRHPEEYFDYDFRTVSLKTRFGGDAVLDHPHR